MRHLRWYEHDLRSSAHMNAQEIADKACNIFVLPDAVTRLKECMDDQAASIDDIAEIIALAKEFDLYTHVDAAWAGSAMICPEFRQYWQGVDGADSIVFNPHKWLGAQFDCSVQFLADPTPQVNTLGLRPAYLQTLDAEEVTNFNEWTIHPIYRNYLLLLND